MSERLFHMFVSNSENMITSSIVLYKNKKEELHEILSCTLNSCIDMIYVIDNSPTDELRAVIASFDNSKINYFFGHGNVGYGAGHNIGIIQSQNDNNSGYHLVLNADVYFEPFVIECLYNFMEAHKEIGSIMPKVLYPDGKEQYLCKLLPTPFDMFGRRLMPSKLMKKRNLRFEMRDTGYDKIRNVPLLSGCFMFIRMSILNEIGLFDDRFFMYFEDYDLIRRIHQVSKTVYYPNVKIVHNHAHQHRSSKVLLRISAESAVKYFDKWGWFFDKERRRVNKDAFSNTNIID